MRAFPRGRKRHRPVIDVLEDRHLLSHAAEAVAVASHAPVPPIISRVETSPAVTHTLTSGAAARPDTDLPDKDERAEEDAARLDELARPAATSLTREAIEAVPLYVPPQRGAVAVAAETHATPLATGGSMPISLANSALGSEPRIGGSWRRSSSEPPAAIRARIAPGKEQPGRAVRVPAVRSLGRLVHAGASLASSIFLPAQQVLLPHVAGMMAEAAPSGSVALNEAVDRLLESFTDAEPQHEETNQGVSVVVTIAVAAAALEVGRRRLRKRWKRSRELAGSEAPMLRWPGSWSASL